ncbi:MAG: GGDEF domain-containing protein [Coriobacteriales bacterium]|nr:GGDEF domain-containing protein [Coriobacteriales bacterium]
MPTVKRPMQRVLIVGCMAFFIALCVVLSVQSYLSFSSWFYTRYNSELAHVVHNVRDNVDIDDLQQCVRTGVPSKKFDELQQYLNGYIDDFELAYLYIAYPEGDNMVSVCSATSEAEREAGDDEDWPLLYVMEGEYTPEGLEPYKAAWDHDGISYFETVSEWGDCYTACLPLYGSDGDPVALLCADVFVDELHNSLRAYMMRSTLLTMAMGLLFGAILILWLRRNVTVPVTELEQSARSFAEKSHGHKDPALLLFDTPDIHTENEIESLSNAITQMSSDMRDYVEDIIQAEERAQSAEAEAQDMSRIAYQDSLTHVKSKAAYMLKRKELMADMESFGTEFALVMVDLNDLKKINDTCGHDHGDEYLVAVCALVCDVFRHSPVYRVGGDEFVVVLQGRDYENRDDLVLKLRQRLKVAWEDDTLDPWKRLSAAIGMAEYDQASNESYDDVFARADKAMYEQKVAMKRGAAPR